MKFPIAALSLGVLFFSFAQAGAAPLSQEMQVKDRVIWMAPKAKKWVASDIERVDYAGYVTVSEHVFGQGMHYDELSTVHPSKVVRALQDRGGIGKDEERCLASATERLDAGTRVQINHVFANQKAEIQRGGVMGSLFGMFQFPEVVDLFQLISCDQNDGAKRPQAIDVRKEESALKSAEQPAQRPDAQSAHE